MREVTLPADFCWHQSRVSQWERCGRQFKLQHVDGHPIDHVLDGFASVSGTALHECMATVLHRIQRSSSSPLRGELEPQLVKAFTDAVHAAQDKGHTTDDEEVGAALDRLLGEQLDLLCAFAADQRLRLIDWVGIETDVYWEDSGGRRYAQRIDAYGRATKEIRDFGGGGVPPGRWIVVDWKTGTNTELHPAALRLNTQLAFYATWVQHRHNLPTPPRTFVGNLHDLAPYKRPPGVSAKLRQINPEWLKATGLEGLAAEKCRKRVRGAPKWIEVENPEYIAATSRPRGPFFHECHLDHAVAMQTIADVIRAAEAGFFPASGALTGECRRCGFRGVCGNNQREGGTD